MLQFRQIRHRDLDCYERLVFLLLRTREAWVKEANKPAIDTVTNFNGVRVHASDTEKPEPYEVSTCYLIMICLMPISTTHQVECLSCPIPRSRWRRIALSCWSIVHIVVVELLTARVGYNQLEESDSSCTPFPLQLQIEFRRGNIRLLLFLFSNHVWQVLCYSRSGSRTIRRRAQLELPSRFPFARIDITMRSNGLRVVLHHDFLCL